MRTYREAEKAYNLLKYTYPTEIIVLEQSGKKLGYVVSANNKLFYSLEEVKEYVREK